jgi:MinD-like ATPase involved in chromosome partitioning or flagellar assembly
LGQRVRILVATSNDRVYRLLEQREDVDYRKAQFSAKIAELLPGAEIVIVDYDHVTEFRLPISALQETIGEAATEGKVDVYNSQEFLSRPEEVLEGATIPGRMRKLPEHYAIAFVSYSGGIGRTTLALDTAIYYASAMERGERDRRNERVRSAALGQSPAMVFELTLGSSALASITGVEMPHLMQLATDPEVFAHVHQGVTLVPMDYENVRMLDTDLLKRYFRRQKERHALTLVDCIWPHGLSETVAEDVDLWVVVASERMDTRNNAQKLYDELRATYQRNNVWVWTLQNKAPDSENSMETLGEEALTWDVEVPVIERAEELRGEIGHIIMSRVFSPVWQEYGQQPRSGLFR